VDIDGVRSVDVWVDGIFVGTAVMGVDTRPAVAQRYPGYPDAAAPVFALTFDSTAFADGFHQVQVIVTDERGKETTLGERTFWVDNELNE
jgi:hypothetical protein